MTLLPMPEQHTTARKPGGRPTAAQAIAIRSKIVAAAAAVLARNGYQNSSLEAIAMEAGVAKRTIYSRFDSKEQLFMAVVVDESRKIAHAFNALPASRGAAEQLEHLGLYLLKSLLSDCMIAIVRLVAAECLRLPATSRIAESGLDYLVTLVEVPLQRIAMDPLSAVELRWAAMAFVTLVAEPATRLALANVPPGPESAQRQHVRWSVRLFLKGYATSPSTLSPAAS